MGSVVIVDYGAGNLQSVFRRLSQLDVEVTISSDPARVASAEKIVLPGVGHFGRAMENLVHNGLADALQEAVLVRQVPVLGICLGMQLMASSSEEGASVGLGWFGGSMKRFDIADKLHFKIPHMGWNEVRQAKKSLLLKNIPDKAEFYFVHSYYYAPASEEEVLLTSEYSSSFTCGIERDNIFGVQFHPEKSHEVGMTMLRNFIDAGDRV
jgi:imidazole glycerol-phosphate synthase subunit HisH